MEGSASGYPGSGLLHDHLGGDPNLLYTFPVFVVLLLVYSKGDRVGRLAVALIFFSLIMSVSALLDTYLFDADTMLTRMSRTAVFGLLFLLLRRHLPGKWLPFPGGCGT